MWQWVKDLFTVKKPEPTKAQQEKAFWMAEAYKELGQSEISGNEHNPRILEYHSATNLKATTDEVPWCSAFVNWVMQKCQLGGTHSAAARSWLQYGWEMEKPAYGCIVVMKRGKNSWMGHVGFYLGEVAGEKIVVLGGNQGNKVCEAVFPKYAVLGYRWPKGVVLKDLP